MKFHTDIPELENYDLVVCGGGPSGIPAAVAARRRGLKVLLVEATGQLGGVGTSAGVSHLLASRTPYNEVCVAGIFKEFTEELAARGGAINPDTITVEGEYSPHGWGGKVGSLTYGVPFDPVQMVCFLDEKMLAEKVDVLFFTQVVDVLKENGEDSVSHIVIFNKSGLQAVPANAVVDATGDADVAARSGCEFVKGRKEDGLMTPTTLIFHVNNVDQEALSDYIHGTGERRFVEKIKALRETGEWKFPYDIFITVQLHEKGTLMVNTTRICDVDGTDGRSLSWGMMRGRSEMRELFALMKKHFPGFEEASIKMVAPVLGVRETRRIVGDFIYTVEDLVRERDFPDTIGFTGYGWDLPDPKQPSYQPMHGTKRNRSYTPMPYRIMVPTPVRNVVCPGRAISVERHVLGPLREQGACYAMGEAAGVAAAMVVAEQIAFKEVDTNALREALRNQNAKVDWDQVIRPTCWSVDSVNSG